MISNRIRLAGIAMTASLLAAPLASAQLAAYSEDFESLDAMSPSALGDAGWLVFANVFAPDGTSFLYNYGAFAAPNGSGAFSNVATGEGGPDQGAQQIVTFSDYNNGDHNVGNVIETTVFQEQTIAAGDGGAYTFSFDAKLGDLASPSEARAFVKTLDPMAGFFVTSNTELDMAAIPGTWNRYEITVNVSDAQAGQILQIGFLTRAANFTPSGVVYDNVDFGRFSGGIVPGYEQDFEALDIMSGTALGDDGWLVGATVFAPDGTTYLYDYFAFPAPNGSGGFSNIGSGEGGPDQGDQQLVVFNDYNNADHNVGNVIDGLVFQEIVLTAADAGTHIFQFDAKAGDIGGASTARAFLKTLDPGAGFATTSLAEIDTTSLPGTWGTYTLAVNIDASQAGQLLQFGFATRAANFEPSGNNYDNVIFGRPGNPANYLYDGDITLCTGTCDSFAALELGSTVNGEVLIDVAPNSSFDADDVASYLFEITSSAPLEPFIGTNPATANPLPINAAIAALRASSMQGTVTGGTTDANGEFVSGNLLFEFLNPPFSSNGAWVVMDLATGTAQVCLFYDTAGCVVGATEAVVVSGAFALETDAVDSDGDGVTDDVDNCTNVPNADQRDTNGDLIGNACDTDISGNCVTSFEDLGALKAVFFTPNADADFNGNGVVSFEDLGAMKANFFMPPGPSAAGCN